MVGTIRERARVERENGSSRKTGFCFVGVKPVKFLIGLELFVRVVFEFSVVRKGCVTSPGEGGFD